MVNEVMRNDAPIRILNPAYGGSFHSDTGDVVPYVLPGELVQLAAEVESNEILEQSAARVQPGCPHFGRCGGCHYQHADYPAQLAFKAEILKGLLAEAGLGNLPELRVQHAAAWNYRNRIRLRVEPSPETPATPFRVGYSRRGSNEFLPIRACPIAAPLLWRAAESLLQLAADSVCQRWLAATSEVELFATADESRLQLTFFLRAPATGFEAFCERLRANIPELAGAGAELDPELNRRARRRWSGASWGAPGLNYEAAGRTYWVSRGAFFQVNRFLVDRLVASVCGAASGALAWDLFAGVGLFSRALAERFDHVVAVEAGEVAAADLLTAGKGGKGRPGFEAVRSSTLDFLSVRELQRERPDLIVLDPPRAGLGTEASAILARIAAPRVVYVSCDPVTLARDLAILTRSTYRIDSLDLIDLFPQTFHLETVVYLSRA